MEECTECTALWATKKTIIITATLMTYSYLYIYDTYSFNSRPSKKHSKKNAYFFLTTQQCLWLLYKNSSKSHKHNTQMTITLRQKEPKKRCTAQILNKSWHVCDYSSKSSTTLCANSFSVTSAAHSDAVFLLMLTCLCRSTLQQTMQVLNKDSDEAAKSTAASAAPVMLLSTVSTTD